MDWSHGLGGNQLLRLTANQNVKKIVKFVVKTTVEVYSPKDWEFRVKTANDVESQNDWTEIEETFFYWFLEVF